MRFMTPSILAACVVAGAVAMPAQGEPTAPRPNVLLVVADDAAFGDFGFTGAVTRTPNIDRLAQQGITFTRFHASPVCSVTRGMLLTGNNPVEVGLAAFDYTLYPPAEGKPGYEAYLTRTTATIAELLRDAGYRTYHVGKWHLGGTRHGGEPPLQWGFDHSYGIYTGGANHWNAGVFHVDMHDPEVVAEVKAGKIPTEPYFEDGKRVTRPTGIYSDDLYTSKLLEYLERDRSTGKPFFAYVAYTTPHAPVQAPDFLIDKYEQHFYELGFEGLKRERFEAQRRAGILPQDAPFPDAGSNPLLRSWSLLGETDKRRMARVMATYAAMMESQDDHVGLLLNYLRETGELDNTLIVYLSDNGPEGMDDQGAISNAGATQWVNKNFNQSYEHVGWGDSYAFIGTDFANAVTGGLSWWKWFIGEGGVRTPLIIVPPKNQPFARTAQQTAEYTQVKDVPMTILDYAGVKPAPQGYQGRRIVAPSGVSMRSFLEGKVERPRTEDQWVVFELFGNSYVVAGDYKAMKVRRGMYGDGQWHLYDIRKDPGETVTLDAGQPERLKRMVAIYERFAKEKGLVPVAENWSPWHGYVDLSKKP